MHPAAHIPQEHPSDSAGPTECVDRIELRAMVDTVASFEAMVAALQRDIATNQKTIDLLAAAQRVIRPAA